MELHFLGYTPELEIYRNKNGLQSFKVARVIAEHKERYIVRMTDKEYEAEILGNLRYTAQNRADFPAVGDWVAVMPYEADKVLIHALFPRKSVLERQTVGKTGEKQIIATNIDYAFIVQSVDRDFSINRIERYLTICYASNIEPIIVLNKTDLVNELDINNLIHSIESRISSVSIFAVSNESGKGINHLQKSIIPGKTYCLLGSSGVGKSTLVNTLSGKYIADTDSISSYSERGRHITSHRELHILESGGLLIDNPGMREVGIADSAGLEVTFDTIFELSHSCKYSDCTHISETGCAVLSALQTGEIDELLYENYIKMVREREHFESTVAQKRQKDKDLSKVIKNFKKKNYKE